MIGTRKYFHTLCVGLTTWMAVWVAAVLPLAGCSGGKDSEGDGRSVHKDDSSAIRNISKDAPGVFDTAPHTGGAGGAAGDSAWSIVIASAPESEPELARLSLEKVQTAGGLPEAYLDKRGKALVVSYGQYSGPSTPEAQRDLAKVRELEIDGGRPFASAMLAPPLYDTSGSAIPEYNLMNVKEQPGNKDAVYTLQIAIYGRGDGKEPTPAQLAEFRASAEKAVIQLRREGDEAFYYHGPTRSTVTVGLFGEKDYVFTRTIGQGSVTTTAPRESFALTELRKKHPHNLLNGRGIKTKVRGQTQATLQPSLVVPVPR